MSRNSSVCIVRGYGLHCPGSIRSSVRFFCFYSVQMESGAHSASYPMGTGNSSPGDKAARV
jgi:hypothetical protein